MLKEWVTGIVIYTLAVNLLLNMLSDNKYGKYIKLMASLILMIVMISPITNLFHNADNLFQLEFYLQEFEINEALLERDSEALYAAYDATLLDGYKDNVEQSVMVLLENAGYQVKEIELELDDAGAIEMVYVNVKEQEETREVITVAKVEVAVEAATEQDMEGEQTQVEGETEAEIKNMLSQYLNLEREFINVRIGA